MMTEYRVIYMTTGSGEEAEVIAQLLVSEELAACVNIFNGMTSIYRWKGDRQHDTETVMIAKTTVDNVDALTQRVKSLHSYDCPCIVSLPIERGNEEFFKWISNEVK